MIAELTDYEHDLIVKLGKTYSSAALPEDVTFGRLGWCFDDCVVRTVLSKGKYRYVEGVASDPEAYTWVLHAWITDGVHAFDPTWSHWDNKNKARVRMPLPSAYIGIEMDILKVIDFMERTGNQGVIANRQLAPDLAKELIGGTL